MNEKKKLTRIVALLGIAVLGVVVTASGQERVAAPQVFGGDMMFRASAGMSKVLGMPDVAVVSSSAAEPESDGAALPDAPSTVLHGYNADLDFADSRDTTNPHVAPITLKYIPAGWTAQPLTASDKVVLGFRDSVSFFSFLSIMASAGYSHLVNGQPNFGTDRGAFGERLGATAIRDTTEQLFTDVVFAPLLREDPRYYVEGDQYGFLHRVVHAAMRPIITRTDSGKPTLNGSLLLGYASASALSYTYYPKINQNFKDTAATFGGSLGGAAIGFLVSEFSDEVLVKLHLKRAL